MSGVGCDGGGSPAVDEELPAPGVGAPAVEPAATAAVALVAFCGLMRKPH